MEFDISLWAIIGFTFAAYAVVGNDALQTLGTFILSNSRLHWTVLFAFAAVVLVAVFTYGWVVNGGDPSYGRLANAEKYPVVAIQWYHTLPPLVLLVITRLGIPVSTSFMVLAIFATLEGLTSMTVKSMLGYGLAFVSALVLYLVLTPTVEKFFRKTEHQQHFIGWVVLQWITTAYLWGVWLAQDFANIFVFLPRELTAIESFGAMGIIVILLAYTFSNKGGPVQQVLKTKSNVTDIRSATIIDFSYASLLFFFITLNDIPMSTTWVFLGLIAGREVGMNAMGKTRDWSEVARIIFSDAGKLFIGFVISVALAVLLPMLAASMTGGGTDATPLSGVVDESVAPADGQDAPADGVEPQLFR
ncbi:hypothetical protein [Aquisalinus flavus]|nr:hypothetical protein [Aquisalinus flavus]MBD0425638.1 hypothetical protein [Aquisalinus flavus]